MLRPRIIPCLLVHKGGLVKTQGFKSPKYVGDPINAVKIFNEKEADELIVLDIDAAVTGAEPDYALIAKLAAECRMPLCYGGGIRNAEQASRIVDLGVEKVAVSSAAIDDPELLTRMADAVGRQWLSPSSMFASAAACSPRATKSARTMRARCFKAWRCSPWLRPCSRRAPAKSCINSIDRDGQMKGYDLELARQKVLPLLKVPLTLLGGAGSLADMGSARSNAAR
jgi:cyclase